MKRIVFLTATIFISFILSCSVCMTEGLNADSQKGKSKETVNQVGFPKIQFDELLYDFGKVQQHETIKYSFIFKNTGTGVLHIKKVKAG